MKTFEAAYFDQDYYKHGSGKNSYAKPYTWENEAPGMIDHAVRIKEMFNPTRVLEVGCALGFMLRAFDNIGVKAWGCDISQFAVDVCSLQEWGKDRVRQVDIRDGFPYADGQFDLVVSFATLEHVEGEFIQDIVRDLTRMTTKWVFISVPISLSHLNEPWGDPTHVTYLPTSWWVDKFHRAGMMLDLRKSRQISRHPCHDVELAFCKGRLPEDD